jgi:hypothetical protein
MGLSLLDQVWHRHRDPWGWVEYDGYLIALAGNRMSNLSGKPTNLESFQLGLPSQYLYA